MLLAGYWLMRNHLELTESGFDLFFHLGYIKRVSSGIESRFGIGLRRDRPIHRQADCKGWAAGASVQVVDK